MRLKKKKKISHRRQCPLHGSSSNRLQLDGLVQLTASAFTQLNQYASSPGNRADCYAEHAASTVAMMEQYSM